MPKMKTKKSAAKRFKVTGSGKVTYNKCGNRHLSTKKKYQKEKTFKTRQSIKFSYDKKNKKNAQ